MVHTRDPTRVYIFDTTNRDGAQAQKKPLYGARSKLIICEALAEAGVDRIEAGFPSSSQGNFNAVQNIATSVQGPMIFGLATVPIAGKGSMDYHSIETAYRAVQNAEYRGIHTFTVLFDPHSLSKYGYTREQIIEGAFKGVNHARRLLGNKGQVEFSFQNATISPLDWVVNGYKAMVEAGADVINIPDTVGYSYFEEVANLIEILRGELPQHVMISAHCHDDLGLATANSLAAVKAGADIVECTVNGIGERAGNAALEEIVMAIKKRPDLYDGRTVGVVTQNLNYLSRLVSKHYRMPVQENKAIVGANAFRHRSGIHQDGMAKGGLYEIMSPEEVGWKGEGIGLTASSGAAGVKIRLRELGCDVPINVIKESIMPKFKKLADKKDEVTNDDLRALVSGI